MKLCTNPDCFEPHDLSPHLPNLDKPAFWTCVRLSMFWGWAEIFLSKEGDPMRREIEKDLRLFFLQQREYDDLMPLSRFLIHEY